MTVAQFKQFGDCLHVLAFVFFFAGFALDVWATSKWQRLVCVLLGVGIGVWASAVGVMFAIKLVGAA